MTYFKTKFCYRKCEQTLIMIRKNIPVSEDGYLQKKPSQCKEGEMMTQKFRKADMYLYTGLLRILAAFFFP
jgi:hypothetical protein